LTARGKSKLEIVSSSTTKTIVHVHVIIQHFSLIRLHFTSVRKFCCVFFHIQAATVILYSYTLKYFVGLVFRIDSVCLMDQPSSSVKKRSRNRAKTIGDITDDVAAGIAKSSCSSP